MFYRYSRWDGTQQLAPFDPDELMEQLSDDLLADGDIRSALQRMMQAGFQNRSGDRMMGHQQLMERLRQQRQQQLDQFQLNDMMKDIKEKLEQVLQTERSGIDRRLQDARQGKNPNQPSEAGQQPRGEQDGDDDGEGGSEQQPAGQQPRGQQGQQGQQGQRGQQGQKGAGGQQGEPGESGEPS